MLRSVRAFGIKSVLLAVWVALAALTVQTDSRAVGQTLPVVSLKSVNPSSEVVEGNSIAVILEIDEPVSDDYPGLDDGRLIGGIVVWDTWRGVVADQLIAFAFYPGDKTDDLSYTVCVADDDGAVQTNRTIRIAVNNAFEEYAVGSQREATVRVLDKDAPGVEAPLQSIFPCPQGEQPADPPIDPDPPPQPPPPPPPPLPLPLRHPHPSLSRIHPLPHLRRLRRPRLRLHQLQRRRPHRFRRPHPFLHPRLRPFLSLRPRLNPHPPQGPGQPQRPHRRPLPRLLLRQLQLQLRRLHPHLHQRPPPRRHSFPYPPAPCRQRPLPRLSPPLLPPLS